MWPDGRRRIDASSGRRCWRARDRRRRTRARADGSAGNAEVAHALAATAARGADATSRSQLGERLGELPPVETERLHEQRRRCAGPGPQGPEHRCGIGSLDGPRRGGRRRACGRSPRDCRCRRRRGAGVESDARLVLHRRLDDLHAWDGASYPQLQWSPSFSARERDRSQRLWFWHVARRFARGSRSGRRGTVARRRIRATCFESHLLFSMTCTRRERLPVFSRHPPRSLAPTR